MAHDHTARTWQRRVGPLTARPRNPASLLPVLLGVLLTCLLKVQGGAHLWRRHSDGAPGWEIHHNVF